MEVVLEGRKKDQPEHVTIESLAIQPMALDFDWVDQSLVKQIGMFDKTIHQLHPRFTSEQRSKLLPAAPDRVDPVAWRIACAWALMHRHQPEKVKRSAAADLIESAIISGVPSATPCPASMHIAADAAYLISCDPCWTIHFWLVSPVHTLRSIRAPGVGFPPSTSRQTMYSCITRIVMPDWGIQLCDGK